MRTILLLLAALGGTAVAEGYIVLDGAGRRDPYREAARLLAAHRKAEIVAFDVKDPRGVLPALRKAKPRHVAIVLRPRQLDFNLARAILQLATEVDDDPFVDFSYGYITGATAGEAVRFVRFGIEAKPAEGLPRYGRLGGGVEKTWQFNRIYPLRVSDLNSINGHVAGAGEDHDRDFVKKFLPLLADCPLVMFAGHGMPREVIHGCDYKDLAGLRLPGGVVLNVACYTGVTSAYFERDWKEGVLRRKTIPLEESFCLSILRSGAIGYTAYTCPRPAGPELDTDLSALVEEGRSLGYARRRDYDKTVLGFLRYGEERLNLKPLVDGASVGRSADPVRHMMLEGATGGVLFGDPALVPFPKDKPGPAGVRFKHGPNQIQVEAECRGQALYVQCSDPTAKMGKNMAMKAYARVPLRGAYVTDVSVDSVTVGGREAETSLIWAVEEDQGERYLQLKVMWPRATGGGHMRARILVDTTRDKTNAETRGGEIVRERKTSTDVRSTRIQPFMMEIAGRHKVSRRALHMALLATAGEFLGDKSKTRALAKFRSEGFRAVCVLIEVGHHHYRTVELLRATYQPGDENYLMALAAIDDLPNYAAWSVLEGLGVADTKQVRGYLLMRILTEKDAGLFMATAKALGHLKEKQAIPRVAEKILEFDPHYSGVELHLLRTLEAIGGRKVVDYIERYIQDERAKHVNLATGILKRLK